MTSQNVRKIKGADKNGLKDVKCEQGLQRDSLGRPLYKTAFLPHCARQILIHIFGTAGD